MNFKFWQRKETHPQMRAYIDATPRRAPRKQPFSETRFIVVDSETSGFDTQRNHILSLATVEISEGRLRIAKSKSWMVFQSRAAMNQAVAVHGILPAQTASGQPEEEVLLEFLGRIQGAVLVGHHIAFDIAMLNAALHRRFREHLRNPALDTAIFAMTAIEAFAKTAYPGQREPSLDEVCIQCGIAPTERHTSEGDAFTTAKLFLSMCAKLQRRLGRALTCADLPMKNG